MPASIVSTCDGPMLVAHYDAYVTRSLVQHGVYCLPQRELLRPYVKGVVYVCGANIGAHALWMARQADVLYAFEPQPFLCNCLAGNFALGGVMNAQAIQCAVSDESGTVTFPAFNYKTPNHYAGLEMDKDYGVPGAPEHTARKARLDSLGLPSPDFVIMDVEGMELQALKGMEGFLAPDSYYPPRDPATPVLCIEWDKPEKRDGIVDWLKAWGYEAWVAVAPMGEAFPNEASFDLLCVHPQSGVPAPEVEGLEKVL